MTLFVTFTDLGGLGGASVAVVPVAVIPVAVEVTGLLLIAGLVSVALDAGRDEAGDRGRQNSLPRNRYTSSSLNCMRVLLVPEGLDADEIF